MLDNNPVREIFFKEIKLDGPLGKIKYYAIRTEFKERDSPHVHPLHQFSMHQTAYIHCFEKSLIS